MKYLKLPIDFSSTLKGKTLTYCSLEESIAQSIMTQITCRYGEVAGRPDYGSEIWELEFNQLVKIHEWEEKVRRSLIDTIEKYEKRLYDVSVSVKLSEFESDYNVKQKRDIRRKADIRVAGRIIHKEIPFRFGTTIYISPLSQ